MKKTPGGSFEEGRRTLLYRLLSPWRRRGASLLQVGLHSGLMPDFFWEAGFDVSALDADEAALRVAADLTGPKVEYSLGQPDYLPFDDASFDYVVLAHMGLGKRFKQPDLAGSPVRPNALPDALPDDQPDVRPDVLPDDRTDVRRHGQPPRQAVLQPVLEDALRVASRGVIILEWNRFSLARKKQRAEGVWPWSLYWMARRSCSGCIVSVRSALLLPPSGKANDTPPANHSTGVSDDISPAGAGAKAALESFRNLPYRVRSAVMPLPVGAILGVRLEKSPLVLTPVSAVTDAPASRAYAAEAAVNRVGKADGDI